MQGKEIGEKVHGTSGGAAQIPYPHGNIRLTVCQTQIWSLLKSGSRKAIMTPVCRLHVGQGCPALVLEDCCPTCLSCCNTADSKGPPTASACPSCADEPGFPSGVLNEGKK